MDPVLCHCLANAALADGNAKRARGIAEEALVSCLEIGARLGAIEAAVALSTARRAIVGVGGAERIEEVFAMAERLIAETGARNLTPFVLVERAELAELRGETQQRESHLRRALEAFTQMGATGRAMQLGKEIRSFLSLSLSLSLWERARVRGVEAFGFEFISAPDVP